MKKIFAISAAMVLSMAVSTSVASVNADEIGTPQIIQTRGGHAGGHAGHVGGHGSHIGGGHGGHLGGHAGRGSGHDGHISGHKSGSKSNSKGSKSDSKSNSKSSKSNSKGSKSESKAPKLSKDESSTYKKGSKVDDKTMKKFAQQDEKVSKSAARDIFQKNNARNEYHSYRRQSIISNPWFWLFITTRNHHRYNSSTYDENMKNKDYLAGYKAGFKDGQAKKDNTSELSKSKSAKFMTGYKDGLEDAKSN